VAARNAKIRATSPSKPLLTLEWENYGKTFACTHSGKYKARGEGKRKRIQSRAMGCKAQACDVELGAVGVPLGCSWDQVGHLLGLSWASYVLLGYLC
jgi:hypothetical protein